MDRLKLKKVRLVRRKQRIKKKLKNSTNKIRLCVYKSNKYLYGQIIDDVKGHTLLGMGTLSAEFSSLKNTGNIEAAKVLGKAIAEKAVALGIKKLVFDRNGFLYHGKIKALADAARENGLEF